MKKGLETSELEKMAKIAHLQLDETQKAEFSAQIGAILDDFSIISEVNVDGVKSTTHGIELLNMYREDKASPSLSQQDALKSANQSEDGFFKAPRII